MAGYGTSRGDLIIGDDTGIAVVPRGELERVVAEADKMLAIDHAMERAIDDGTSFKDAAANANYIR